jgi:O-antigen ligase
MENKKIKNTPEKTPIWLILFSGCFITLYFNPSLQDPFNSPKLWLLMLTGSWLAGYLIIKQEFNSKFLHNRLFYGLLSGFIISLFISALLTESKFVAFFGDSGRRLGFLTYLFLVIFMLVATKYFTVESLRKIYFTAFFIGVLSFSYALMQSTGNDFASWVNPYNSIIGTLGNPNFASSAMAIYSILSFAAVFVKNFSKIYRMINLLIVLGLLFLIVKSESRQGLIVFFTGALIVITGLVYAKNKKAGIFTLFSTLFLSLFAILGMLQIGPLQKYLYKPSVTVRGYYWDAAIEMFKSSPLFGVGIDQYGLYFKQFRDLQYPLNYGFEITSSNAHNVPLQLLSTGGIFVGIFYLFLTLFITARSVKTIMRLSGDLRGLYTGLFAAWLGFQAQSVISIDNIGLSIWNWIFGGALIAISYQVNPINSSGVINSKKESFNSSQLKLARPMISGAFALFSVILISALYSGEVNTMKSRSLYDNSSKSQSKEFYFFSEKALDSKLNDPYYKLIIIEALIQSDNHERGMEYLVKLHKNDPNNLDYLRPLAIVLEQDGNKLAAIKYRNAMVSLDPWNLDNYLRLGYLYRDTGDQVNMKKMLNKIMAIAPNHIIATTALQQLSS